MVFRFAPRRHRPRGSPQRSHLVR